MSKNTGRNTGKNKTLDIKVKGRSLKPVNPRRWDGSYTRSRTRWKLRPGCDLLGYTLLKELAQNEGVTDTAIIRWMLQREIYQAPYAVKDYSKIGYPTYIKDDICLAYAQRHGEGKLPAYLAPKGQKLVPLKTIGLETSPNSEAIRRIISENKITVYCQKVGYYLIQEDAELVSRIYRSRMPLPGWVSSVNLAKRHNRTPDAVRRWLKKNPQIERREFYNEYYMHTYFIRESDEHLFVQNLRPLRNPKPIDWDAWYGKRRVERQRSRIKQKIKQAKKKAGQDYQEAAD